MSSFSVRNLYYILYITEPSLKVDWLHSNPSLRHLLIFRNYVKMNGWAVKVTRYVRKTTVFVVLKCDCRTAAAAAWRQALRC